MNGNEFFGFNIKFCARLEKLHMYLIDNMKFFKMTKNCANFSNIVGTIYKLRRS